jgi:DTW domain-containing protein YfiP
MPPSARIIEYQNKKLAVAKSNQIVARINCSQCHRPSSTCVCSVLRPFNTKTHFCLLMHPREARKEKVGTGRMTHLCLTNSQIIVDEEFTNNKRVNDLIQSERYDCMILYPGDEAHNITAAPLPNRNPQKELLIFVIDGTWSCAKSMMRDSLNLHHLPKISFDGNRVSRFYIKHQPASFCLSTIESIYYLLNDMNQWGLETLSGQQKTLLAGLERLCAIQVQCSQDPTRSRYRQGTYRPPSERQMSKKWQERKICFDLKNYQNQKDFQHLL